MKETFRLDIVRRSSEAGQSAPMSDNGAKRFSA
jgi:hypothetical protein